MRTARDPVEIRRLGQVVDGYLRRRRLARARVNAAPASRLGMVVVIPCRDEPDLVHTLSSLAACDPPQRDVEVLVVVNASASDPAPVGAGNRRSLRQGREWRRLHGRPDLPVHFLHFPALPPRHAGVGLARKLGMDEAAGRLALAGSPEGVIVCLDADCVCDPGYLRAIEAHFDYNPHTPGCSIYFEHPLSGGLDPRLYEAITHYELYLRYHVGGLRLAGVPFAYHTVGSAMAVRAWAYASEGGMSRRQAGEDFYFLQKLIALGRFSELNATRVVPSPRLSERVPFGTGRAMRNWLENPDAIKQVDAPGSYRQLSRFTAQIERFHRSKAGDPGLLADLPDPLSGFLERSGFRAALEESQRHTGSLPTFRARLFRWMNAFRTLKFLRFARSYPGATVPLAEAAAALPCDSGSAHWPRSAAIPDLLARYRAIDRAPG